MKEINWSELGFSYYKTDWNVRCSFKDGQWGEVSVTQDEYIPIHMASTCLHYGQEAFEGLKAFCGVDGKVRLFRAEDNARRMISSAEYLRMQAPSVELFTRMVMMAVEANKAYIPPYGTGASLYVRPLLIGIGPQVGVRASKEYMFVVFVMPVGPYFKEGFNPIRVIIDHDHDRAAPHGTGHIKVGGNYAASIGSSDKAHDEGYANVLYLDPKDGRYIDECGAANFFGIRKGSYITPDSHSVLPSITNMSLKQIAADMGLTVECRKVELDELATFEEAGACGTAAVISPIGEVYDPRFERHYTFGDKHVAGEWCKKLYKHLQDIQYGIEADTHNWCQEVKL